MSEFLNVLSTSMGQFMSFEFIIAMTVGVLGGMVIGALPGLSATMGIALLMPFTFNMSPVAGLTMLMAIYTSAITGGSIPAILIHTPGTSASAATAMDGYELTKQGKGLKALGISMICSSIGGVLSVLALLLIAPPLAKISLKFNAPEYFLIACFGLCIISSLATESVSKGLLAGVIGLAVGLVGIEPITGFPRLTFGSINLESGFNFVPAMIGLFALPQVFSQIEKLFESGGKDTGVVATFEKGVSIFPTLKEFVSIIPTIIRSSIIGIFIGILPGAGSDIACWVSYNEAKRFSKNRDKFGKGSIEGIAASEAANNAVTGGAMIPLLTLGIPGSAAASVLLGGLMIQGLVPGHQLFTDYAEITYSVIIGFGIASVLMGIVGLAVAKYVVNVTKVPTGILSPIIVVLTVVGSFAIANSFFDMIVMFGFGIIGFFMRKMSYPAPATVLAMILGDMAESGFRQSLILAKGNVWGYYFSRPICLILMILIILGVGSPIVSNYLRRKKGNEKVVAEEALLD